MTIENTTPEHKSSGITGNTQHTMNGLPTMTVSSMSEMTTETRRYIEDIRKTAELALQKAEQALLR